MVGQEKFTIIKECKSKFNNKYVNFNRVYSVLYSLDDDYIYSGSDDTNIRCWKSESSRPDKLLSVREKTSINYRKKLQEKFKFAPEIKRIIRKRNLPKYIVNKQRVRHIQKESKYRKLKNVENNSRLGTLEYKSEKKEKIVQSGVIEK